MSSINGSIGGKTVKNELSNLKADVRVIPLGLGKVVTNWGTHNGVPCVIIEPVLGEPGPLGGLLPDGREPQIPDYGVSDGAVIIEIHDQRGLDVVLEDFRCAMDANVERSGNLDDPRTD